MSEEWSISQAVFTPLIPGWFAEDNRRKLHRLIVEHDINSVVEVGSFLGLSAVWFAQFESVQHVHCVDTWFEPATYESENNLVGTLRRWDLPRDFFPLFRDNVMRSGVWHKITPIKGDSRFVIGEVPVVDLVYLDGNHTYEGCKRDIELYQDKARVVLCGDDYTERKEVDGSPCFGVIEAVTELLPNHQHSGPFWWCDLAKEGRRMDDSGGRRSHDQNRPFQAC
jgi:methyltransferase family protein